MNLWAYHVDTPVEWVLLILLVLVGLALYFVLVWFIQKYTTGMVGGFLMMVIGLGLVMGPAFYIVRVEPPAPQILVNSAAIVAGCITILVGVFSLRDFEDF